MKNILTIFAAALSLLATSTKADFVDSNMNFSLKFYINEQPWQESRGSYVRNITTVSIKTADFISAYADAAGIELSKKARLIWRDEYDSDGDQEGYEIFIRDPGRDDINVSLHFLEDTSDGSFVSKGKYRDGLGNLTQIYTSVLMFLASTETPAAGSMEATGINNFKLKTVIVKETGNIVDLGSVTGKISGKGLFKKPKSESFYSGIVDGTFKLTGPKVVKMPN